MKPKRRLLFITGSRGEWGYIRPILRKIERSQGLSYSICATNMHLLPTYGHSLREIEADGFNVEHKIYMAIDGSTHIAQVKSLGAFLSSMADVLSSARPDWIVLAGDRGEQLMAAIAGAFCYVPVAHIQAGELSGNIDGMTRHAIGKYAHLHFASNEDAAQRLLRLGEEPFRVHNVGAPQVDELVQGCCTGSVELTRQYGIAGDNPFILVVQHPVTEEFEHAVAQIDATMSALRRFNLPKVVILPNNDAGSLMIREGIDRQRHGDFHVFANLRREDYLGFMKLAACLVGNSSSGILEAPTFELPAVNLGRRQQGRMQARNVIDAPFEEHSIVAAITRAISPDFRRLLRGNCPNPYGDGRAAERILSLLEETEVTDRILVKSLTY
jgi:GDP/UDP-N,N'-diacetylbacillosamine 2-epimerase (hydrolysing)